MLLRGIRFIIFCKRDVLQVLEVSGISSAELLRVKKMYERAQSTDSQVTTRPDWANVM